LADLNLAIWRGLTPGGNRTLIAADSFRGNVIISRLESQLEPMSKSAIAGRRSWQ